MKKSLISTAVLASVLSFSSVTLANAMEKCEVVNATGHKVEIMVNAGECDHIAKGEFTSVSKDTLDKMIAAGVPMTTPAHH